MIDKETINALFDLSYGLYIVSSNDGEKLNGQITNSVFQVTAEPAQMAIAVSKNNLTHSYIEKSRVYSVSTLKEGTPMEFVGLFGFKSGRDINKFEKTKYVKGTLGAPIVTDNCISGFEVKVTKTFDVGTHTLFVGDIIKGRFTAKGKPLTYDYYYRVMRGKTPRNATTYKPAEATEPAKDKEKKI
jgi:ferric-chelate reductase [NAD(P)H]